ncbi:MAG: hypothetical protein A3F13_08390 [Gammaproteobacteria bacterium RIFCSPHIGHO2_12_FULL_40_19]|nr:MAG: hypothetical protein A3F13_08390 [Gammaproteobacteria bacterium RIFCSPHIGHO2_12_FULL_40_19]
MQKTIEKLKAEQCHREGNFSAARILYESYLSNHPDDADALHAFGVLLAQCQEYSDALIKIEAAIEKKPHQATYYNSLGNVFRRLLQSDKAVKAYQKAIKIQPDYAVAYNNLGTMFYAQKKLTAAQQAYEKAIALKNDYADAVVNLGILFTELENDRDAMLHLKKALDINPQLFTALNQLSDLYLRHDQFDEAIALLLKSLTQSPQNIALNHRLGVAYFRKKDFESAKIQFEAVLMLDHKYPEVNQYIANTLLEMGDHEKALHYYFCQLEINPWFETCYNIGVLLMMKERLKEALLYFHKAEQMDPHDVATQLNLGSIYLKKNDIHQAIVCYQKANDIKPDDAEIQHILSALTQQKIPDNSPAEYVTHLFDQYAAYYEKHLTDVLKYDVPKKFLNVMQLEYPFLSECRWQIVDLGCGTGLCGPLFKPFSRKLIGVDLSDNMLQIAKQKNCYDKCILDDVVASLNRFSAVDLILAADVFTYIGDLAPVFSGAKNALLGGGLFIFTVEKTTAENFVLQTSIRYAHSKDYLGALIALHHFEVMRFENVELRKQNNNPVEGYLVLLKRSETEA